FHGAAIGGFHDAGAAPGADDEATRTVAQGHGPEGEAARKLAGFLVVTRHFKIGAGHAERFSLARRAFFGGHALEPLDSDEGAGARQNASRAENDDGVADVFPAHAREGIEIFAENANGTSRHALDKLRNAIRG